MATTNFRHQDPPVKKNAFVHKLYRMLNDASISHLIWWTGNPTGNTFSLTPGKQFAEALSKYFKHGNVASFVRQLHMYGFHKVTDPHLGHVEHAPLMWEFRHSSGKFRRGDEASLAYIRRRPQTALQRESAAEQIGAATSVAAAKPQGPPYPSAPTTVPEVGPLPLPFYHQYPPLYVAGTASRQAVAPPPPSSSSSSASSQQPQPQMAHIGALPPHVAHYANPHLAGNFHAPYSGYVYYAAPAPQPQQQSVPMYAPVLNPGSPLGAENPGYFAPQAPYAYALSHVLQLLGLPVNGGYMLPSGFPQGYGAGYPVPHVHESVWRPLQAYTLTSVASTPSELPGETKRATPYIIKREQAPPSPQTAPSSSPVVIQQTLVSGPAGTNPLLQPEKSSDISHKSLPILDRRSLSETALQFRKPFETAVAHRNRIPSLLCDPLTNAGTNNHHHHQNQNHHLNNHQHANLNGADAERRPHPRSSRSWTSTLPSMEENSASTNGSYSPRSNSNSILNPVTSPTSSFVQPEADGMRKTILTASTGRTITEKIRPSLVELHSARPPQTTAVMKSMESVSSHSSSVFSNHSSISSISSGRFLSFGSISQSIPPVGIRCISPLANAAEKDVRPAHLSSLTEHSSLETSERKTCVILAAPAVKPQDGPSGTQLPKVEFMLETANNRQERSQVDE